ncbi:hypothetical protein ACFLT0_00745 [Chloroflexota bacterium]
MKFFRIRRKGKLYRQWVKWAGLPPEATSPEADEPEESPTQVPTLEAVSLEARKPVRVLTESDSAVATHPEITGDMLAEINRREQRPLLLPVSLGASLIILCVGLILLIVVSC